MPRVKQKKMRLNLDPGKSYRETIIHFSYDNQSRYRYGQTEEERKNRFYVDLRKLLPQVADALGMETVRAETLEGAEKAFDEAIDKFKNLSKVTNRLILYSIEVGPLPKDHPSYNEHAYDTRSSLTVKIWAGTYEETKAIAGNDVERHSYVLIDEEDGGFSVGSKQSGSYPTSHDGSKWKNQVPLTNENKDFFHWIKDRMGELIMAMADLKEPEHLIDAINSGRLLPLGGGK